MATLRMVYKRTLIHYAIGDQTLCNQQTTVFKGTAAMGPWMKYCHPCKVKLQNANTMPDREVRDATAP